MYYLKRHNKGIIIKDESSEYLVSSGIKKYLNNLCMNNLSTFDGRRKAIVKLLEQKDNIPIYIDSNNFVYPTKSLREFDMIYINYFEVLSYKEIAYKKTLIVFKNLEYLVVDIDMKRIERQHKRIKKITEYLAYSI